MLEREVNRHGLGVENYWERYLGVTNSNRSSLLDSLSPAALAKRADAPILLIHGKDDTVVPIEQSLKMQSALKAAGKPVETVILKGEDHWLSIGTTRTEMLKASIEFVEKYNPAVANNLQSNNSQSATAAGK